MVKKKFIVPNLFTSLNFLLGIYAILLMTESMVTGQNGSSTFGSGKPPIIFAAWMVTWCVLFDKLDGFAAKILDASSEFGAQFDSLADLTAFGIAPGFLVYFYLQWAEPAWFATHRPMALVSASVYMLCAALRLARYNAIDSGELKEYFHGLPSTFAGGFMAVSTILFSKYDLGSRYPVTLPLLPLLLIFAGLLMVSPLYLPKLLRRNNKAFNLFQIGCIFATYLCGFTMMYPGYLYVQMLLYGIVGFTYGYFKKGMIESALQSASQEAE